MVWLPETRWAGFVDAGARHGYVPRRSDALKFARDTRVLLLRHEPSLIDADVSFGDLAFEEEMIRSAEVAEVGDIRLPVPRPEDLLVMKAIANRSRDRVDIESLVSAYPDLDREKVLSWVREFASVLEMLEILEHVASLLKRPAKRPRVLEK